MQQLANVKSECLKFWGMDSEHSLMFSSKVLPSWVLEEMRSGWLEDFSECRTQFSRRSQETK